MKCSKCNGTNVNESVAKGRFLCLNCGYTFKDIYSKKKRSQILLGIREKYTHRTEKEKPDITSGDKTNRNYVNIHLIN